jgi:uncharacterized protein
MPSDHEQFFSLKSFAMVGDSSGRPFPKLTYGNLKGLGKEVYAVDQTAGVMKRVAELGAKMSGSTWAARPPRR